MTLFFIGQSLDKTLLRKIARFNLPDVEETEREMFDDFQCRSIHLIDYQPGNPGTGLHWPSTTAWLPDFSTEKTH